MAEAAAGVRSAAWSGRGAAKFSWEASGRAIYFERTFRAAGNIWRMSVDPQTLRATAIERFTTGQGPDTELSLFARCKETGIYHGIQANPRLGVSI